MPLAKAVATAYPLADFVLIKPKDMSKSNGVRIETTRYDITTISFYCRNTRWDYIGFVKIRRDSSFRFRGKMRQYGPESQLYGKHVGRFSGRFTSRNRVRIKRKLPRCGTARVKAKHE